MTLPSIKVVEHPDLFIETNQYSIDDFDYIIELREHENQKIEYDHMKQQVKQQAIKSKNTLDFGEDVWRWLRFLSNEGGGVKSEKQLVKP